LTIVFWMKAGGHTHSYLFSKYSGGGQGWAIITGEDNTLCAFGGNANCDNNGPTTCLSSWTENVWDHYAVVFDNHGSGYHKGLSLYKNGQRAAEGGEYNSCDIDAPLTIGEWDRGELSPHKSNDGVSWTGELDEIMIFKRELNPVEIATLYTNAAAINTCYGEAYN
jgi:hypothetical protein